VFCDGKEKQDKEEKKTDKIFAHSKHAFTVAKGDKNV
jgi:hypothetical protein